MALELIIIINGVFSIIIVLSSIIMSLLVLRRYKKYKQKTFLYLAFTAIGIYSFWWPSSISFLIALFNDVGLQPFPNVYFIIMGLLTTPLTISWMLALDSLMQGKNKRRRILIIILSIESIIIETIYLITAILNPIYVGDLESPVDIHITIVGIILFINFAIIITSITVSFSINSMKSNILETRIKARIILINSILFFFSTFADGLLRLNIIWLTIVRILLILSVFLFYCGFHLPNFIKKIFIK